MISITGDEQVYNYARFLERIQEGEGSKFLYTYYDKKCGNTLYSKKLPCVYRSDAFILTLRDFPMLIKLEALLDRIVPILDRFFDVVSKCNLKIHPEAVDIRTVEGEVQGLIMQLNSTLNLTSIDEAIKGLNYLFPVEGKSVLENKIAQLMAHYEKHGTKIYISGLHHALDLVGEVDFSSRSGKKVFMVNK